MEPLPLLMAFHLKVGTNIRGVYCFGISKVISSECFFMNSKLKV